MSTTTPNLGLIKPELRDVADITLMNENWDKIDDAIVNSSGDYIPTSEKGIADGVATLDSDGKLPSEQLPDDVGSVKSVNGFTGEIKLYSYGTTDMTSGTSELETGKLYFVYE